MADTQHDDLQADLSPEVSSSAEAGAPEAQATEADASDVITASDVPVDPEPSDPEAAAPGQAPQAVAAPESVPTTGPSVETSTIVPPLGVSPAGGAAPASDSDGEGGEWALLVDKLQAWWGSGELQNLWRQSRTPLTVGLALIAVLLVLQVYAGLLGAINSLPLVPGLLELVGLIWAVRHGLPKLIRRSEREQLLDGLRQRWSSFRGKN
jgi:hypothetical protein